MKQRRVHVRVFERIANLTWRRPSPSSRSTLLVGDRRRLLRRATSSSTSRRPDSPTPLRRAPSRPIRCARALGYDPDAGIALVVRAPGGGPLDLSDPAVQREIERRSPRRSPASRASASSTTRSRRGGAPPLIERDGESVVITGHLSTPDVEEDGGRAAEDAKAAIGDSSLDVDDGRVRPELQRGERPDARGPDQGRDDRLPDPGDPAALIVFRGVIAASIPLLIGVLAILMTFVA